MVATETLSKTASTATPANCFCSSIGMPSLLNPSMISGSTSSKLVGELAIERFSDWAKNDHSLITPNYITDFNFNNISSN